MVPPAARDAPYHYYVIDTLVSEARRRGACRDAPGAPTPCPLAASRPLFLTGASAYEARRQGACRGLISDRPTSRPLAGTTEPPPLPHWGAG